MEAMEERKIWQRVRGTEAEPDLRQLLQQQGQLASQYRILSRRGGKCRQLFEQKEAQIACLRGLLRVRTGQSTAHPPWTEGRVELMKCYALELEFLKALQADEPVLSALRDRQSAQCRLLLEIIGTM